MQRPLKFSRVPATSGKLDQLQSSSNPITNPTSPKNLPAVTCTSSPATPPSKTHPCPICGKHISALSIFEHTNACLDSTHLHDGDDSIVIPSPPPLSDSDEAPPREPETPPRNNHEVDVPIATWLTSVRLEKYVPHLLRAGFRTMTDIITSPPDDRALRERCEVIALGARRKLLDAIDVARRKHFSKHPTPANETTALQSELVPNGTAGNAGASKKRKVWAIFEPGYVAPVAPEPEARGRQFGRWGTGNRGPRKHSVSHRVPGTSYTVDSFQAAQSDPGCLHFFLTHFHADHYGGLRRKALPAGARVFCSAVTASLVRSQLYVPAEFLVEIPIGKKVDVVDDQVKGRRVGASVWAFDANHCPGAVVLLFRVWRTGRWVLHTGDCRFDREVFGQHSQLVDVIRSGQLDYLHLDTTYCDARYAFPRQRDVVSAVVAAAQRENTRTRGRCLFFFGTYSIGKERVFLAVADALNLRIFAGKRKRSILSQLGFGARVQKRLVETPGEARVHVMPMRQLSPDELRSYATRNHLRADFIGRGLAIVFRPTGWAFQQGAQVAAAGMDGQTGISASDVDSLQVRGVSRSADQAMFYNVPYSEHSSFSELKEFVQWAKPARILPTVNARSADDAKRLCQLLGHVDKPMRAAVPDSFEPSGGAAMG